MDKRIWYADIQSSSWRTFTSLQVFLCRVWEVNFAGVCISPLSNVHEFTVNTGLDPTGAIIVCLLFNKNRPGFRQLLNRLALAWLYPGRAQFIESLSFWPENLHPTIFCSWSFTRRQHSPTRSRKLTQFEHIMLAPPLVGYYVANWSTFLRTEWSRKDYRFIFGSKGLTDLNRITSWRWIS